jgi:hypothetical protein
VRHLWLLVVTLLCTLGLAARVTGRSLYTGVKTAGEVAGALLVIATLIAVVLHVLHKLGVPVPDLLPLVSLPN